jgi:hypothetical protein
MSQPGFRRMGTRRSRREQALGRFGSIYTPDVASESI